MDRETRLAIDTVPSLNHVVLNVATYSVLWTEERSQLNVSMFVQQVRSMTKAMVNRRLITDQPHPRTLNSRMPFFK
jgi:hypothetical protein